MLFQVAGAGHDAVFVGDAFHLAGVWPAFALLAAVIVRGRRRVRSIVGERIEIEPRHDRGPDLLRSSLHRHRDVVAVGHLRVFELSDI